jgi:uncharacterized protein (DUF58 family)
MTTATTNAGLLLSPHFMHRLDQLDVLSRKVLHGKLKGERRSKKRGQSVEFADYRNYVIGDDLRFVDWNLYARLDRLFLRLFMEEEDMSVSLLVDVSRSMDYGEPNKLHYAKQLAAALGYIGLVNYNRVNVLPFSDGITQQLTNLRGRRPIPQLMDFIASQETAAGTSGSLSRACRDFALMHRAKGIVIIVSDFLDKGDIAEGLRYLTPDRYDVYGIQLLAPQEVDPRFGGDLRLQDVEDNDLTDVSISPALLKRYRATVEAYCNQLRHLLQRRDMAYMVSDTSVPFDQLVLRYLRERGLLG